MGLGYRGLKNPPVLGLRAGVSHLGLGARFEVFGQVSSSGLTGLRV